MSDGRLVDIHDRELVERRRGRVHQLALALAFLVVVLAVAVAARSILLAAG